MTVPVHLQEQILLEHHGGIMAGYFSGEHLYNAVSRRWWWDTHYIVIPSNSVRIVRNMHLCQVMEGGTNYSCTLSQCNDHSRSWELILWSYQSPKEETVLLLCFHLTRRPSGLQDFWPRRSYPCLVALRVSYQTREPTCWPSYARHVSAFRHSMMERMN